MSVIPTHMGGETLLTEVLVALPGAHLLAIAVVHLGWFRMAAFEVFSSFSLSLSLIFRVGTLFL